MPTIDWNRIIIEVSATSVIISIVAFIGRGLINRTLDAGVERYRLTLQSELEAHKARLQLDNHVAIAVYQQQSEVVRHIFSKIHALQDKTDDFLDTLRDDDEDVTGDQFMEQLNAFKDVGLDLERYYEINRILLDKTLSEQVLTTINSMEGFLTPIMEALDLRAKNMMVVEVDKDKLESRFAQLKGHERTLFDQHVTKASAHLENDFVQTLSLLEDEFRRLIRRQLQGAGEV